MNESIYSDLLALKARGQLRDTLDIILDVERSVNQRSFPFFAKVSILKAETCIELGWLDEAESALKDVLELEIHDNVDHTAIKTLAKIRMAEISRLKGLNDNIERYFASLIQKLECMSFGLSTRENQKLLFLARVEYGEYKAREGQLAKAIDLLTQAVTMNDEIDDNP